MISSYVGSEGNEERKKCLFFSRQKPKVQSVHRFLSFKKKATGFGRGMEFSWETQRCNSGWHAQILWHNNIFPPFHGHKLRY